MRVWPLVLCLVVHGAAQEKKNARQRALSDWNVDVAKLTSSGDTVAVVNASADWGTWEGWGTSLAWLGEAYGNRDDVADLFFTLNFTTVKEASNESLPGLGLTIVRFNAGASSDIVRALCTVCMGRSQTCEAALGIPGVIHC